jgi:hypothetical protein
MKPSTEVALIWSFGGIVQHRRATCSAEIRKLDNQQTYGSGRDRCGEVSLAGWMELACKRTH